MLLLFVCSGVSFPLKLKICKSLKSSVQEFSQTLNENFRNGKMNTDIAVFHTENKNVKIREKKIEFIDCRVFASTILFRKNIPFTVWYPNLSFFGFHY